MINFSFQDDNLRMSQSICLKLSQMMNHVPRALGIASLFRLNYSKGHALTSPTLKNEKNSFPDDNLKMSNSKLLKFSQMMKHVPSALGIVYSTCCYNEDLICT